MMISVFSMLCGIRRNHGCSHRAPIQRFDSTHKQRQIAFFFLFDLFYFSLLYFVQIKYGKLYHLSLLQSWRFHLIFSGQINDNAKGKSNTEARAQNYSFRQSHGVFRVVAETIESFHLFIVPLLPN